MLTFRQNKTERQPGVKVTRTVEGTAFEIAIALLNIIMWVTIGLLWSSLPEQIPVHFNFAGEANGYGEKWVLLLTGLCGTFVSALMCFCAYRPSSAVNMPVRMTTAAQFAAAVRMVRILGVIVSLMFISIVWSMGGSAVAGRITMVLVVVMLIVVALYTWKIHKLGKTA